MEFVYSSKPKMTVEKSVRNKPTLAELTKIEVPGRPVPATNFEKPKRRKSGKPKSENISIKQPRKDSILIITEKPQAAQKIAFALGSPDKTTDFGVSYYSLKRGGEKIIVASAVGHLLNLTYEKGQFGWPIFKIKWVPSFEKKATFTKKYYDVLKKLSKRAKEVVIATDYDIEGEVIGWNALRFICGRDTAKRMKYSTLTKAELENAYENLMSELDWGQAYAGETRHIIDWLYGINLSRALMSAIKKTGSFRILSIGRVQGPALKVIVDREKEISAFKSEPFWQVLAKVGEISLKHPKDIFKKSELEKFNDLKEGEAETKIDKERLLPPHPLDLTTLQREAYRLHKISPSQTLQTAQKLYLDGLISYPRTSSQKIPDSINPKKILKELGKKFPEVKNATRQKPIEGKKSDPAHPSIYPTGEIKPLAENEKKLYEIIARRFISAFSEDALLERKKVTLTSNGIKFTATGLKILDNGWMNVYPAAVEESQIEDLNGKVKINKIDFLEKETQPPKRYTPTSLITILEKKNLGTKSTRSVIVDTLFDRGYLDGKSIKATPLGMKLIETLEKHSPIIIDENLTRSLEEQMEKIQTLSSEHEKSEKEIIQKTEKIIMDISKDFKLNEEKIGLDLQKGLEVLRETQREENTLVPCGKCGKGSLRILYSKKTRRYFVACSAYPECKSTYSLPPNALIKKSEKQCESCTFPKLLAIRKARRPWEFCFNKDCEIVKKQREEWEKKKALSENNQ